MNIKPDWLRDITEPGWREHEAAQGELRQKIIEQMPVVDVGGHVIKRYEPTPSPTGTP